MTLLRRCLEPSCVALTAETRCQRHEAAANRRHEARRGSRAERGYGADHVRARAALAETLPAPCGYCGETLEQGERWVAAHVRDGQPEFGWTPAHPRCNERHKVRRR